LRLAPWQHVSKPQSPRDVGEKELLARRRRLLSPLLSQAPTRGVYPSPQSSYLSHCSSINPDMTAQRADDTNGSRRPTSKYRPLRLLCRKSDIGEALERTQVGVFPARVDVQVLCFKRRSDTAVQRVRCQSIRSDFIN